MSALWPDSLLPFSLWPHTCTVHECEAVGEGWGKWRSIPRIIGAHPYARVHARPCMLAPPLHELLLPIRVNGTLLQANGGALGAGQAA